MNFLAPSPGGARDSGLAWGTGILQPIAHVKSTVPARAFDHGDGGNPHR